MSEEFGCDGCTDSIGVALSQGAGCVLHSMHDIYFGVSGCDAAPLAECFEVIHGVLARQCQLSIQHRGHMSRIQEEAIATGPLRVLRVKDQILGEEYVYKVRSAHGSARVTAFGFFHHCSGQYSNIVRSLVHQLFVIHSF